MNIIFCDEHELLTEEYKEMLVHAAAEVFSTEIEAPDTSVLPIELSVTLVDGEEIKEINAEFRGIDKETDVLSFPQFNDVSELEDEIAATGGKPLFDIPVGDVVICYDRVLRQAEEYGTGIQRELTYLFVHSCMHLLGYDHMEEDDRIEMRQHEEAVMARL